MLEGSGHGPHVRDPVKVNLLLRDFIAPAARRRARWVRGACAPQARALHLLADRPRPRPARRGDRRRAAQAAPRPRDRLARPAPRHAPCSRRAASAIHPGERAPRERVAAHRVASRPSTTCTASRRSAGWTRSCSPTSWSSTTSCATSDYDLWIGDEAWELDYYLHENPELKRRRYAWLTDFVGWLPMPDGGEREAFADRRLQRRDDRAHRALSRACATGRSSSASPTTSCPDRFGPDLPLIRDWTERALRLRRLRHRLRPGATSPTARRCAASSATRPDERVCIVTVGGSGVGERPAAARDRRLPGGARERVAGLRMIVVAGPRIDPGDARRAATGSRSAPTSTTSTATSRPATSRSSRAG